MNDSPNKAEELAQFCQRLYRKEYIAGNEGNLSIRLDQSRFIITPGGLNKGYITADDMVVCDQNGTKLEGAHVPSSEVKIHATAYRARTDVNAVCHAHPVFATSFSVAGVSFNEAVLPEFVVALGIAPLVKYATPGSDRLAANLAEVVGKYDAFLLRAHGTLTLGASLTEAFNRTEILERYAGILFHTRRIGNPPLLPLKEAKHLLDLGGRKHLKGEIIGLENSR